MGTQRSEELTLPGKGKENSNRRDDLLSVILEKDPAILVFKRSRAIQKAETGWAQRKANSFGNRLNGFRLV